MDELASILSILGPSASAVVVVFMFLKSQTTHREEDRLYRAGEEAKQRQFQAEQRDKDRETYAAVTQAIHESSLIIGECNKVIGENNVIQTESQTVMREMSSALKDLDSSLFKDLQARGGG